MGCLFCAIQNLENSCFSGHFSPSGFMFSGAGFGYDPKANDYKCLKLFSSTLHAEANRAMVCCFGTDYWREVNIDLKAKCRKHSPLLWLNPAKVEMPRWPYLDIFTHVQTGLIAPTSYRVSSLNLFVLIEHGRMRYLVPRTEEFELHRRPIGDEQS
ncbi:hypothetical protein L484_026504 [Morus notabilis]|uniref:Uncharacterized protein n=1 Tax=Morus notabilis TaxID=981085 RepID=W9RAQ4_9ROSA|nr:hypothetical protein L484_026504 [Morus notabilis]